MTFARAPGRRPLCVLQVYVMRKPIIRSVFVVEVLAAFPGMRQEVLHRRAVAHRSSGCFRFLRELCELTSKVRCFFPTRVWSFLLSQRHGTPLSQRAAPRRGSKRCKDFGAQTIYLFGFLSRMYVRM